MTILLNRIQLLGFFVLLWGAWFHAAVGGPVEAFSAPKKTVLVLYGDPLSIPANRMIEQGLTAALLSAHAWALEVFSEYLDLARFPAARYGDDIVRYSRARYGTRKPDVLITVTNTALQFVLDRRDELFPGVPIVFTAVDHREVEGREMPPNVAGLWTAWDYQRTLELALQLQPQTREVICVAGTGVEDQAYNNEARKALERFATHVRVRWLDKLRLPAVMDEVARLPLDSVVLYIPMLRDGAGQSVSPFKVAWQLAEASRVPVYGLSRPQLEQGIIGGALVDFSEIGSKTAALALRVLAGERLPVLSAPDPAIYKLLINWRALKKWHVSESRIPGAATVLYREPSLWQQHPRLILATAAILVLQSLLIIALLSQRARRRRAEIVAQQQQTDLAHAARLTMVGELTASIAHEINQSLGAILSNAETAEILLGSKQPHLEEVQQIIADIRKDDLRASEVIRRMRELLRKRELELEVIDLNAVTSNVLRLVEGETRRRGVEIEKHFADTLPVVRGDVIHLQQVLLNLILNGMEAMSESSESNRRLKVGTAYDGEDNVEVAVEDSGPGIPPDRLPRLFDSFFTTKLHGMGLGLSIVRSIVEAHGGRIWAENNSSGGACFRFTLPVNRKAGKVA
jgi:signal transduction histidine kinase